MWNKDEDTFCKKMRKATKEIHTVSDTLVNAKLAFGKINRKFQVNKSFVFM